MACADSNEAATKAALVSSLKILFESILFCPVAGSSHIFAKIRLNSSTI
jgi:hypothetical protein